MVSKCSFDSLSLQECFEQFLIGVSGLASQLLLPLPPQSLQEENKVKMKTLKAGIACQLHTRMHAGTQTYKGLLLQQRCIPIKHKDWPDAEEQ